MEEQEKRFRLEIEGLRAIAAVLVAVYHIWFHRVSGGVDVFFVVSGFLITLSLLSMYRRKKKIHIVQYIVKLLRRLVPTAWVVAILTLIFSFLFLSVTDRFQIVHEFLASVFYVENWRLIVDSADYLAENHKASPYQHFWALSIQWQFYMIWLFLFFIVYQIIRIFRQTNIRPLLIVSVTFIVALSFVYSVQYTAIDQPVAYYHTLTRVWEFGLGSLLALFLDRFRVSTLAAIVLSWVGVIGLLIGGFVFQVGDVFPGYAALWPTLSAAFIIIAGNTGEKYSAYRLLSARPLVSFGSISYAFYLWHWPLLIFYYALFDVEEVSVIGGFFILIVSALFAYITTVFIEKPLRQSTLDYKQAGGVIILGMTVIVSWYLYWSVDEQKQLAALKEEILEQIDGDLPADNPGALVQLTDEPINFFNEQLKPSIDLASRDLSPVYEDRCITRVEQTNVVHCEYGETEDYEHVIALVGGSHAAHWQPMLDEFGQRHRVKIDTYLKPRCRFTFDSEEDSGSCKPWFDEAIQQVVQSQPDLIFTTGDTGKDQLPHVPASFVDTWRYVEKHDIDLFLMRDGPWFPYNVANCLAENRENPNVCKVKREEVIVEPSPMSRVENMPSNVHTLDVTDYYCDDTYCYPIIGNVIVYFDSNHFTATFSRTMAPIIGPHLLEVLEKKNE